MYKCYALGDLVPIVQLKKREKYLWRGVTCSLLKVVLLHGCFSTSTYHFTEQLGNLQTYLITY